MLKMPIIAATAAFALSMPFAVPAAHASGAGAFGAWMKFVEEVHRRSPPPGRPRQPRPRQPQGDQGHGGYDAPSPYPGSPQQVPPSVGHPGTQGPAWAPPATLPMPRVGRRCMTQVGWAYVPPAYVGAYCSFWAGGYVMQGRVID